MTAISGAVGSAPLPVIERTCRLSLSAQRRYSRHGSAVATLGKAAFGVGLYPTVPEDFFDRQPFIDATTLLAADVRLDNRPELIGSLGQILTSCAELSDAGLLFMCWKRWGVGCLDRLIGDYAIAVYERADNRLYLARDHAGQRPLCYSLTDGLVRFASMPSGLLAGTMPSFNLEHLAAQLRDADMVLDSTPFHGAHRVLPGEVLAFEKGQLVSKRRWSPTVPAISGDNELIAAYRTTLDQAVSSRMRRIGPGLATHLSSGYDSSAVTATAARLAGATDEITAYTSAPSSTAFGFRGRPTDEADIAAATARSYGLKHVVVRSSESLLSAIPGHALTYQEPVRTVFNMGWWKAIEVQAAAAAARVLLTGEKGNMTLNAGGLPTLSEWIHKREFRAWWLQIRRVAERSDVRWRGALYFSFRPWLPKVVQIALERAYRASPRRPVSLIRRHLNRAAWPTAPLGLSRAEACLDYLIQTDPGPFRKGALAATGIDERDPTSDKRIVEFSFAIPPEQMLAEGAFRPLAQRALADRLSTQLLQTPLRAVQGGDWAPRLKCAEVRAMWEEASASTAVCDFVDPARMERAIASWCQMDGSSLSRLALARELTSTLATAMFIREIEREPGALGA